MKVSREKARENHEHVIDTASRLLRERGYDGIGVADLMKAAGLTHGGFYRNFSSKDDLIAKASKRATEESKKTLNDVLGANADVAFDILINQYASKAHCDDAGSGCILPALAADAARRPDPALRTVFDDAIAGYIDQLTDLQSTMPKHTRQRSPAAILAEMVGAVVLARAAGNSDIAESLLSAVVADLTAQPATL